MCFEWGDAAPRAVHQVENTAVAAYESGLFYKRELPCLLHALNCLDLATIACIVIDGHVYIDADKTYGLGGHLWAALGEKIPVIGVAKRPFHATEAVTIAITRGGSLTPLYISAIGTDLAAAAHRIQTMHGPYRVPTMLKIADTLTRQDF